jgi:glycosyltransferase involved in cell wall biosynthesis
VTRASIIIPTYNRASLVSRAIESAKRAGRDVEVIVVDNGSTDETADICKAISGIRYLRLDPNVRQARGRNAGLEISRGEYVTFLDDDDQRLPGSLDGQIDLLESNPRLGFVYGPVLLGDSECVPTGESSPSEILTGDLFWSLVEKNFILLPAAVARKSLVEEVGAFEPSVVGAEDWLLLMRLAERHEVGAVHDPVAICRGFTRTSGQTSSNRIEMCEAGARALELALTLPRALEDPPLRKTARQTCLDMLTMSLLTEAEHDWKNGMRRSAIRHFGCALRLNPKRAWTLRSVKWLFFSPWNNPKPSNGSP